MGYWEKQNFFSLLSCRAELFLSVHKEKKQVDCDSKIVAFNLFAPRDVLHEKEAEIFSSVRDNLRAALCEIFSELYYAK